MLGDVTSSMRTHVDVHLLIEINISLSHLISNILHMYICIYIYNICILYCMYDYII